MLDQVSLREEHFLYEMCFDASDVCFDWECLCKSAHTKFDIHVYKKKQN